MHKVYEYTMYSCDFMLYVVKFQSYFLFANKMLAIKDTFHKLITFPNRMLAGKQNKKNNINYLRMYECEHKRNSKC